MKEALRIVEIHRDRWIKKSKKHVRAGGRYSDYEQHDLDRAKICEAIAIDIRRVIARTVDSSNM